MRRERRAPGGGQATVRSLATTEPRAVTGSRAERGWRDRIPPSPLLLSAEGNESFCVSLLHRRRDGGRGDGNGVVHSATSRMLQTICLWERETREAQHRWADR